MNLRQLLATLNYDQSSYYRSTEEQFEPETAHLFRAAYKAGVKGIYVFQTSPDTTASKNILPARPVVYIAEADTEEKAKEIHRSLWNLRYAPFLIILLPHQIRVYTGFDYPIQPNEKKGLLDEINLNLTQFRERLSDLTADAIDTGRIWQSEYVKKFDPTRRVDTRLLANLRDLSKALDKALSDTINNKTKRLEIAHALIGKYIYIRYLHDRKILSDKWLLENGIDLDLVLGRNATAKELHRLVDILEKRFNGYIFPLDIDMEHLLTDQQVSLVASIFKGDEIIPADSNLHRQLHLNFKAYDFQYIPVETLSSIYEQFLRAEEEVKNTGAIYTPENLADYLLSEMNWAKPLSNGMKVLDPACGSGIFLVLVYRRLIEIERAKQSGRELDPEKLKKILLESIYGVERKRYACHVTEFSLILTLLHYIDPPELHKNTDFKFPNLHNERIFESDFFDDESKFWQLGLRFDWIAGNPPWIELNPKTKGEELARQWITENHIERPVAGNRVADAFSWRVMDSLQPDGVVGLILPATTLFNLESREYRQKFFQKHEVVRITNFANLRDVLFDRRATLPAATIIYRHYSKRKEKPYIIHYRPFSVNQTTSLNGKPWTITINENEIQSVSPYDAESGETSVWKYALWGTHFDQRAIDRFRRLFPNTLEEFCGNRGWEGKLPCQGPELRKSSEEGGKKLKYRPDLRGKYRFDTKAFNKIKSSHRFSMSSQVLQKITEENFVRRGEDCLDTTTSAPHIILSAAWGNFIIFSNEDFIIPPRQMGISGSKKDIDYLKALSVYLNSSLTSYYIFFHTQEWGVFRHAKRVTVNEVRKIPTPNFTPEQAKELALFQEELVEIEKKEISHSMFDSELQTRLQTKLDKKVFSVLEIPEDIATLATEFMQIRLQLDKGQTAIKQVKRLPNEQELLAYAQELRDELDDFVMGTVHHKIDITWSSELIECVVEIIQDSTAPIPIDENSIRKGDLTTVKLLSDIRQNIGEQFSQWVYVQRGLRLFDGPKIYIYKPPRLIDWTRTQALNDASDIIGQVHSTFTRTSIHEELRA